MALPPPVNGAAARVILRNGQTTYRSRKPIQGIPTLQEFMQKMRVIHLYRDLWRAVGRFPDVSERIRAREQIRREFRMKRTDALGVSMAIREGDRRLRELVALVGSSKIQPTTTTTIKKPSSLEASDNEEIKPVGVGWPWERSK